jgi:hypothetical protein
MTETKTTSLQANEWQSLCQGSALQIANVLSQVSDMPTGPVGPMTTELAQFVDDQLGRLVGFVHAWAAAAQQERDARESARPGHVEAKPASDNGAAVNGAEPVRRGGWPKGKPRKPRATAPATESVQ